MTHSWGTWRCYQVPQGGRERVSKLSLFSPNFWAWKAKIQYQNKFSETYVLLDHCVTNVIFWTIKMSSHTSGGGGTEQCHKWGSKINQKKCHELLEWPYHKSIFECFVCLSSLSFFDQIILTKCDIFWREQLRNLLSFE